MCVCVCLFIIVSGCVFVFVIVCLYVFVCLWAKHKLKHFCCEFPFLSENVGRMLAAYVAAEYSRVHILYPTKVT